MSSNNGGRSKPKVKRGGALGGLATKNNTTIVSDESASNSQISSTMQASSLLTVARNNRGTLRKDAQRKLNAVNRALEGRIQI